VAVVGTGVPENLGVANPAYNPAGARFQLSLVCGLSRYFPGAVSAFSAVPAVAYPRGRFSLVRASSVQLEGRDVELKLLAFVNATGAKEFSLATSILVSLLRWGRLTQGARRTIVVYNVFSPFSLPVLAAARLLGAKAVAVVADTPHGLYEFRRARGLLERLDFAVQVRIIRRFDGVVALTPHISEDFAAGRPTLLLEGGIDDAPRAVDAPLADGAVCLFSGTLNRVNGVALLLDGFELVGDPRARLWVFGGGELQDMVREAALRDPRITYFGMRPNAEVRRRQQDATLLINPRFSDNVLTRYTFPSKLLEYMASGRPVLTTALAGIPEEYYPHVFRLDAETPEGLAAAVSAIIAQPADTLAAKGRQAREFVLRHKTWQRQAERVHEFIEHIWDEERPS
jgi:glycosyltransferase involved in cell wall biosynthesis